MNNKILWYIPLIGIWFMNKGEFPSQKSLHYFATMLVHMISFMFLARIFIK